MKKILSTACIISLLLMLGSCEIETSDNGKLDGFWQLATITTIATEEVEDVTAEGLTWGFQGRLLQLREATLEMGYFTNILCRFEQTNTTLTVSSPVYNNRDTGDPAVEDIAELRRFGISALTETFTIVELTSSRLKLKSPTLQLELRKY